MARGRAGDAAALGPTEVMPMGTSRGADALRLPVGRIAPDHAADLVVLDLDELSMQPDRTTPEQIVAGLHPRAIRRVIVGGETVVEDGHLARVDERELVAKVREAVAGWRPVDQDALAGRR
jgi:5-methylthioadenosine/S-adenosylhomocysteine deaminase